MRLELSRFVEGDIEAIADFIAEDSPARAVQFVRQIWHAILKVGDHPYFYQLRPEVGKEARMVVVGHHLVLYRVVAEAVRIERVVYGGRDLPRMLLELESRPPEVSGN